MPLYAVSSDPQADHGLLRQLAEASGGAYFNLARVADEAVLGVLGRPAFSLLSVEHEPGAVAELLPAGTQPVLAGRLSVAPSTLRNLLSGAYLRLNVSTRAAAVAEARRRRLLPPEVENTPR